MTLRIGVCLLQEHPWRDDRQRWQQAERDGFHTLWTYDHLSWRSLRDGPWYAAIPLLTAAASVTSTARLGTLVASPNFRHPVPFAKEVMTLDDISGGRLDLGLGTGGTGADATVLGQDTLPPRERTDRFTDFVDLLDELLRNPATSRRTPHFEAEDARMIPGCVQQPRVPFTIAGAGPRAIRLAAQHAQTWVTFGPMDGGDESAWWDGVTRQRDRLIEACHEMGRNPDEVRRMALVSLETQWQQSSPEAWDRFASRLVDERFTDVVVHWPRPDDPDIPGPSLATFDHIRSGLGR